MYILVIAPAPNRISVDFLSYLPRAGSHNGSHGVVELQDLVMPIETEKIEDFAAPAFLVGYQFFVGDIKNRAARRATACQCAMSRSRCR